MRDQSDAADATSNRQLSRRGALGGIGAGAVGAAGCLDAGDTASEAVTSTQPNAGGPAAVSHDERANVRYVESAAGANEAMRQLPETGGIVRWKPGSYTGEDFTEMIEFPATLAEKGNALTLDMRSVDITIAEDAPYRGSDGAFFYKPPSNQSVKVNILGPNMLTIEGKFDDVDPRSGRIRENEGEADDPFTDENPAPHVFYLYDIESSRVSPAVDARHVDRVLYFRQNQDCGHHVSTFGFRSYGGNVGLQASDPRDECGKDRCHFYGQIAGYREAAVYLAGKAKSNRVWAQAEGAWRDDATEHVTGYRIENTMNSVMLTHIASRKKGGEHPFDIQARNCGIFAPCTDGNPQPFKRARLGVRPSNIYKPNYTAQVFDFGTDYRPNFTLVEDGGSVGYEGREREVVLEAGPDGRAGIQTSGVVGRMGHHLHGYANARVRGEQAGKANAEFRFGAWADGDNHAMVTYDPRRDRPLGATIRSGGERLDTDENLLRENAGVGGGSANPSSWIAFVQAGYQAFFFDYNLVYEGYHDLTGWPTDPHLRADTRDLGEESTSARIRRLEYGDARKAESAEEFIAQRGRERDWTIDRPWRREGLNVG
jgi:hypothetical protein